MYEHRGSIFWKTTFVKDMFQQKYPLGTPISSRKLNWSEPNKKTNEVSKMNLSYYKKLLDPWEGMEAVRQSQE